MTDLGQAQRRRVTHVAVHVILVGLLLVFLGPFFWLVSTSFKTDTMMFKMPPQWIPDPLTLEHYRQAFVEFPALRYMGNTLIIVVFSTVGTVLSCAMGAYAFSRLKWPDRGLVFSLLLATMMIPGQVTMIPVFIMFAKFHWVDTFLPLIVPAFFGNAFFIFLLRQFFMTIPEELLEAARLD
ncbi:MAG: carbohydrate ABC transporter permease, partial [Acidobacteria bacterium]|nr:carbohydrate ABC transporter permease [Acidobacteriota bacterium]